MTARRSVSQTPRSIFVLKPSSFGDVVHTLPAVVRLKARWPDARISWLVNPEWSPLLRENPLIDEVVIFPRQEFRGWRGILRLRAWLRSQIADRRPDLAVDFQGLLRTALVGRSAHPEQFVGLADAREGARWFYDRRAPIPSGVPHAVERYLGLSNLVIGNGETGGLPRGSRDALTYPLPAGDPVTSANRLEKNFVLLHPFSRGTGKSLGTAQVEKLCASLSPRQVVVIGKSPLAAIELAGNTLNLLNQTSISELLWLIRKAAFIISVDSGPVHLAAALNKPLLSIHTWSDPRRVGPYRPDAWVFKNGEFLQMRALDTRSEEFFRPTKSDHILSDDHIETICRIAISPSDSCA